MYGADPIDKNELNEQRERAKEIVKEIETRKEYDNFLFGRVEKAFEPITVTDCETKKDKQFEVFVETVKEAFENKKEEEKEEEKIEVHNQKIENNNFI